MGEDCFQVTFAVGTDINRLKIIRRLIKGMICSGFPCRWFDPVLTVGQWESAVPFVRDFV